MHCFTTCIENLGYNYHAEKSLNSPLTTVFLFFPTTAVPVLTAAGSAGGAFLAFKYLPTPPPTPVPPDSDVPAPGLLYHEPTLS